MAIHEIKPISQGTSEIPEEQDEIICSASFEIFWITEQIFYRYSQ
jgi:hypothetical protein